MKPIFASHNYHYNYQSLLHTFFCTTLLTSLLTSPFLLTAREPIALPPAVNNALKNTTKVMDKLEQAIRNGTITLNFDTELFDIIFDVIENYSKDLKKNGPHSLAKTFNAFSKKANIPSKLNENEVSSLLEALENKMHSFRKKWLPTILQALAQLERDIKSEQSSKTGSNTAAQNYISYNHVPKPTVNKPAAQQAATVNYAAYSASQNYKPVQTKPIPHKLPVPQAAAISVSSPISSDDEYYDYDYERSVNPVQKMNLLPVIAITKQLLAFLRPVLAPTLTQLFAPAQLLMHSKDI